MKTCRKCGETKDYSEYFIRKNYNNSDTIYYHSYCKSCISTNSSNRYKDNKKVYKNRHSEWYLLNKDCYKDKAKTYYNSNRDKILTRQKKYYQNNKENIANYQKEYNINNKYSHNCKIRDRYNTDMEYKISMNIRRRLRETVQAKGIRKTKSAMELCGCNLNFLKCHIESQFTKGMTWGNWSLKGWHIDHIRPCASFDLTDPEQQKQCFHYTNLQPLWAEDNLRKSDKWEAEVV